MVNFILGFQTAQNRNRAFDGRFIDGNRLEPPLECRVFSDGFAVLVRCETSRYEPLIDIGKASSRNSILTCGGTDQLKSSGEGRLDHLTCINAPLCFAQVE